ncbi:MAG: alpha/beta fold hydrolase [Alphaproteobacteria bacterium]
MLTRILLGLVALLVLLVAAAILFTPIGSLLVWPGSEGELPDFMAGPSDIPGVQRAAIEGPAPLRAKLSYLRSGDGSGRQVIFVHGTPGHAEDWRLVLADPWPGFEIIAVDRPGFGRSDPARVMTRIEDQAAALVPLLETREAGKPILVGWSLGGPIVARAAIDVSERLGGIVIVAGSLDPDLEEVLFIQRVGQWPMVKPFLARWARNANAELIALEAGLRRMAPHLSDITMPVGIVHGTEDSLVPFENVAFMKQAMTGADMVTVTVMEGRNHFMHMNGIPEIKDAVLAVAAASAATP